MKFCTGCKVSKIESEFNKKSSKGNTLKPKCKSCRNELLKSRNKKAPDKVRSAKLRNRYGIDLQGYENLLKNQDYKCAICLSRSNNIKTKVNFYVDHCHDTNAVRGLLCQKCNTGISNFKDDPSIIQRAVYYLSQLFY